MIERYAFVMTSRTEIRLVRTQVDATHSKSEDGTTFGEIAHIAIFRLIPLSSRLSTGRGRHTTGHDQQALPW